MGLKKVIKHKKKYSFLWVFHHRSIPILQKFTKPLNVQLCNAGTDTRDSNTEGLEVFMFFQGLCAAVVSDSYALDKGW